jgi:hypothetical protein
MCKEMPVIPVNKVVDPKRRIIGKMGFQGGVEAQGVADPKKLIYIGCHLTPGGRLSGGVR